MEKKLNLNWEDVESSNVNSVAFYEPKHLICVRFNNGGLYTYSEANQEMFTNLTCADSVGKYLNQVVKVLCPYTKWDNEAELIASLV